MMAELTVLLLVLVPVTASAAFSDLRTGLIPNRLVVVGLVAGVVARLVAHVALYTGPAPLALALQAVASCVLGICLCGAAPYLLFRLGAMGGGDVKLLAAVGAGAGPMLGLRIQLCAFIVAALYAIGRLALAGRLLEPLASSVALLARPFRRRLRQRPRRGLNEHAPSSDEAGLTVVRFAPAICAATLLVAAECWGRA